ncbi:MAG: T9SS type A sorting domain-containing protein [Flavobacteriales bacterium]
MKRILFSFFSFAITTVAIAQCEAGEVALTMNIAVDPWPWETYWQIVPSGNDCGDGIVAEGSNPAVGCENTATGDSEYPANTVQTVGPYCLTDGETYDLIFNDSWGDGGLGFELMENGITSHIYWAAGFDTQWTFTVGDVNVGENDSPCSALEVVPNGAVVALNNELALAGFLEPHPTGGNCAALGFWCASDGDATNTVWAYFVAESDVSYEITTCNEEGSFDTQLTVFHATECGDFSTYEMISSNDDMAGGCGVTNGFASTCFASCLIPGDTYYIQLDGWQGAMGDAHLSVYTYDGDAELAGVVNNVPCPLDKGQEANGSIIPYVIGEGLNFTCEWSGPGNFESTDNAIYNLQPGVYELTLTTPCGQVLEETYEVFLPEPWNFSATAIGPDCPESGNGNINVSVSGASEPYNYNWTAFNFSSDQQDISNLNYGIYNLNITDNNGCTYQYSTDLQAEDDFQFDLGNDTTICNDASLLVFGPAGLEYLWQDGSANQFYQIVGSEWPAGTNALILTASTEDGCSYTDAFVFEVEICNNVTELNQLNTFSIAPNPVSEVLTISVQHMVSNASILVTDATGRRVSEVPFNNLQNTQIDMNFPAGLYMISLLHDGHISSKRIVKL